MAGPQCRKCGHVSRGGRLTLARTLVEHRGEVEYDFRREFHASFRSIVETDVEEALRLAGMLLRDTGTRLAAAVAGWDRPISTGDFILASIYSAWSGQNHPLLPEIKARQITDVERRLADLALENMNRR